MCELDGGKGGELSGEHGTRANNLKAAMNRSQDNILPQPVLRSFCSSGTERQGYGKKTTFVPSYDGGGVGYIVV